MLHQVEPVEFKDIPDGSYFRWAGSNTSPVMQKTLEDGGPHNCVLMEDHNKATFANHNTLVIPVH